MPLPSSILLLYAPSCLDVGVAELPTDVTEAKQAPEFDSLLPREEIEEACGHCTHCNKRKRAAFEAYPETAVPSKRLRSAQPLAKSRSVLVARLIFTLSSLCKDRRRYKLLTRYRCHKQKKPYSSISVHIERLTSENYDEDDLAGIPDLIEVIRLQDSGPTEAARAIRKKLKYANVHRQLRALTILDGLLQNGGPRFQRAIFCDEPLLERLRIAATDPLSDPDVREKCKVLFGQWAASSKTQPELAGAAALYKQLPKKTKALGERREQSKVLRENEEESRREDPFAAEEDEEPSSPDDTTRRPSVLTKASGPASPRTSISHTPQPVHLSAGPTFGFGKSSKKDKKKKTKGFNLEREKPAMLQSIAASSVASTNLSNALKLVNREQKRVSEDPEVMSRFETCKQLRRHILRYIQYVETDDFLGGLIHANEELVTALMAFEVMDKSVDDDSDSELEEAQHLSRTAHASDKAAQSMAGLSLTDEKPKKPPRPGKVAIPPPPRPAKTDWKAKQIESDSESEEEDDDPNDPFGDKNAAMTPRGERKGYTWKEV